MSWSSQIRFVFIMNLCNAPDEFKGKVEFLKALGGLEASVESLRIPMIESLNEYDPAAFDLSRNLLSELTGREFCYHYSSS